jgi:hypothetical protein
MDPDQPVLALGDGVFLADAPRDAIDTLVALTGPDAETPLQSVEIRHLGGALARDAPGGGAQAKLDAKYVMFAGGATPTTEQADAVRAHLQAVKHALTAWRAGYDYYNFDEIPAEADAVVAPASYQRLREIKARYDPDEAIISAHPVRPAGQ